jgi:hypothetical protein
MTLFFIKQISRDTYKMGFARNREEAAIKDGKGRLVFVVYGWTAHESVSYEKFAKQVMKKRRVTFNGDTYRLSREDID